MSRPTKGFLDDIIHPVSAVLTTAEGASGSYSTVLCKLLNTMGFITRMAQMKVNGVNGGYIIVEANTSNEWVLVDPKFNLYFTTILQLE